MHRFQFLQHFPVGSQLPKIKGKQTGQDNNLKMNDVCTNDHRNRFTLKVKDSSRNLRFSVGTNPAKKILIPSLTEKGRVTTPYAPGFPYKQQMKSDK